MNLRTKLLLILLGCGLIPLTISGTLSVRTASQGMQRIDATATDGLKELAKDQLTAIRDLKKQQIQSYLHWVG